MNTKTYLIVLSGIMLFGCDQKESSAKMEASIFAEDSFWSHPNNIIPDKTMRYVFVFISA